MRFPKISSPNSSGKGWVFWGLCSHSKSHSKKNFFHLNAPQTCHNWPKNPNIWYFVLTCAPIPEMQKKLKSGHYYPSYGPKRVKNGPNLRFFATFVHLVTPVKAPKLLGRPNYPYTRGIHVLWHVPALFSTLWVHFRLKQGSECAKNSLIFRFSSLLTIWRPLGVFQVT